MHAAALRLEIRLPGVRSLKAKRRVLKALMGTLGTTFPVAVGEVGFQDQWQRATLGVAMVAPQAGHLERLILAVTRLLREHAEVELLEVGVSYLEER
ncbi:MAG: DUF503 domain-containing protein [Actinobacteria bacterium]|nr:DUF503 domain-containing protein [Actinomycetota bacterium]